MSRPVTKSDLDKLLREQTWIIAIYIISFTVIVGSFIIAAARTKGAC